MVKAKDTGGIPFQAGLSTSAPFADISMAVGSSSGRQSAVVAAQSQLKGTS
jgi:hypothetical protein